MVHRGMVDDGVQNQLHAAGMNGFRQLGQRSVTAIVALDMEVVGGVVAVIAGTAEHWREVERRGAQVLYQQRIRSKGQGR